MFTAGFDMSLREWEIHSGRCVRVFSGHRSSINSLVADPHNNCLITSSQDGMLIIWDLATGTVRMQMTHASAIAALAIHNGMIALGLADGSLLFYRPTG